MKKYLIVFSILLSFSTIKLYSQCEFYGYTLTTTGFGCQYSAGEICVSSVADIVNPLNECSEYFVEIEYAKGDFIYYELGDFHVHYEDDNIVKLRAQIQLIYDVRNYVCMTGFLQEPDAEFTLRIIHPETGHVVNGEDNDGDGVNDGEPFYINEVVEIGIEGDDIFLSQAIGPGKLLPADESWNNPQNVRIYGNLIIDLDYEFGTGSSLYMEANSSIIVKSPFYLSINNSKVYNCDNNYWHGIQVESGATFYFRKSTIKNAEIAIELMDNSTCEVYASNFDDNNVGIGCYGNEEKNISLLVLSHPWLGSTSFNNGEIGIQLENTSEPTISNSCLFNELQTAIYLDGVDLSINYNEFDNCTNGILVYNSPNHIDIYNNWFYDVMNGIIVTGVPLCNIKNNYFEEGEVAIIRTSIDLDELTYIEGYNDIIDYDFGVIGSLKQSRGNIMENYFNTRMYNVILWGLGGDQIWATQYNYTLYNQYSGQNFANVSYNNIVNGRIFNNSDILSNSYGISIYGGTFNNIGYNSMYCGDNKPGIKLEDSDLSSIYCNDIEAENGSAIVINTNNSGSDIRGNNTQDSNMGLQYGNKFQTYANTGKQLYKGNIFDKSSPDNYKAINYSRLNVSQRNQYIVGELAGNQGSELYPYFISEYNKWFDWNPEKSDYECPSGNSGSGGPIDIDDYIDIIKQDTSIVKYIKKDYGDGGILVDAKVKTIEHILEYWELGGNMFNDVFQDSEYQEAAQIATINKQFNDVLTLTVIESDEADSWSEEMNEIVSDILEFEIFTYDPVSDSVILHTDDPEYLNLLYRLDTTKVRFSKERSIKQAQVDEVVSNLIVQCDAKKNTGSIYAQYYYDILSLCMKMQLSNFESFTSSQKDLIDTISEKCSYFYPDPVFLARSLRATYDLESIQYSDDCTDNPKLESRNKSATSSFEIYPNPVSDQITISTKNYPEIEFEIINNMGKVVDIIEINKIGKLDVSKYKAGIYFIKDKKGEMEIKKFTVVK